MPNNQASPNSQSTAVGTAIASAATLVLSNDGNIQHVTGAEAISNITFTAGQVGPILLITDGACSFVHLAGTLETDTGATITAAAKDMFEVLKDTGGIIRVRSRGGASGSSAVTYTDPTTNKVLNIGDRVVHNVASALSLLLRVTTSTDQAYRITIDLDSGGVAGAAAWLYPNSGVAITGAFDRYGLSAASASGVAGVTKSLQDGFICGWGDSKGVNILEAFTSTTQKSVHVTLRGVSGGGQFFEVGNIRWTDATAWTLLGKIVWPSTQAGVVTVERIL